MTADCDRGTPVCLVCNASIGVSTRNNCPIFQYNVTSSEQPVANILSVVLGQEVRKELVHSEIICKKCYKLCNEVDELQERLTEIKMEINNYYQKTLRKMEGGQEDDIDSGQPVVYYPQKKVPHRKPGRPKKIVQPQEVKEESPKVIQENGAEGLVDEEEVIDEEGDEDQDVLGIGVDDARDADYTPKTAKKPTDGIRKVHETLVGGASDNFQIKLEVLDEENDDVTEKPLVARRKQLQPQKKKPANEYANIIPQMALQSNECQSIPGTKRLSSPCAPSLSTTLNELSKMIISREGNIYTCLLCSADQKVRGDSKQIVSHMKETHNIRLYICDVCGLEFLKRSEISAHIDQHVASDDRDFECEVCGRVFSNLRLFRVHKRMHFPQPKNHICETCGKAFLSRNMLEEHINTHTGVRPYKCGECGKEFASKYSHRAHEKTHTERPRPFKCNHCLKSFVAQANLIQHERTHSAPRNFSCQICGKSFSSGRNLEVHCVIHTGYKPFVCRICGKAFARKAEIRDHERTHTGEKPYQCEFCGATFGQRSNLQSHKRATHYDDKRYQCIECGKAFKRRRLLDYHVKAAHTGERPYKCQICSATFIYPEHFKKHRRIHTGEKPYLCEVCGKAFNSRDNRNAHRFVHSDKKPYECLVCGMGFMRKPQLYNHMQSQGHVNDTIVVNQPRLTTDDDFIIQPEQETQMEMIITENQEKWEPEQVLEEGDPDSGETKMFIKELKEHVIIQNKAQDIGDETQTYAEDVGQVGHLIIDGPVHYTDGEGIEIEPGTTIAEGIEPGQHSIVVPAARHTGEFTVEQATEGGTTVQTPNGPVHLVISLPDSDPNQQHAWFNLVQQ